MELGFWRDLFYAAEMSRRRSCDEDVVIMLVHRFDYPSHLINSLSTAEYDFRKPLPQRPMVIDIGESKVFKRQRPEALHAVFR